MPRDTNPLKGKFYYIGMMEFSSQKDISVAVAACCMKYSNNCGTISVYVD